MGILIVGQSDVLVLHLIVICQNKSMKGDKNMYSQELQLYQKV